MNNPDVERNVEAALIKIGLPGGRRLKILSDNGSYYISEDIITFIKEKGSETAKKESTKEQISIFFANYLKQ